MASSAVRVSVLIMVCICCKSVSGFNSVFRHHFQSEIRSPARFRLQRLYKVSDFLGMGKT